MNTIFLIGIIIFSISAGYFSVFSKKQFNTAFLVSALMAASYIMMYNNILTAFTPNGEALYWTRWVVYAMSCSLLMYTMAKRLEFKAEQIASTISLNVFVMITGALASILTGWSMIGVFALSSYAYILMIKPILFDSRTSLALKSIIIGGWGMFPVLFLLSYEGFGIVENLPIAIGYLTLDIITKIGYYFIIKD